MQTIETKVVGVTYENRQAVVTQLKVGEVVYLVRNPENEYDPNAIKVYKWDGRSFGFLNRSLASVLVAQFDRYRRPVKAIVSEIKGGYSLGSCLGVVIKFDPPE